MTEAELLDRLAAACGIGREYHDVWGRPHRTGPETQRALLRAMGVPAGCASELAGALAARQTRAWGRCLEPVQVVREPRDGVCIELNVPAERMESPHVAVLCPEGGGRHEQPFVPRALALRDSREVGGRRWVRCALPLAHTPAQGYHDLTVLHPDGTASDAMRLIVVPDRGWEPEAVCGGRRLWGAAIQLYALRSSRNWGVGDFADLERLAVALAERGAGILGVNPLHAGFPTNPAHASPYSPSSRLFLNTIYLDVEALPEYATCEAARRRVAEPRFRERLATLREAELVDYPAVAAVKREILELCHEQFRRVDLARGTPRGSEFRAWVAARGEPIEAYGRFEALAERLDDPAAGVRGWPLWPGGFRRPESSDVARFADEQRERVAFHQWLQWLAERQLDTVGRRCRELGSAIGIYRDLAVSVDRAGFDVWRRQAVFAAGASYGAPPDELALQGQDWGLPPWIPERLREAAYEPFVEVLRANMRHAGALRIDHVMGLMRAFWVPAGGTPADGAYVRYPFADLLGILALESRRNRCLVVGEDLGTVPDEVRAALGPAGVLSYRLLCFMKDERGEFLPPAAYPAGALVAVTTHDLPTLAGFWSGRDISLRAELGLLPAHRSAEAERAARETDRTRLLSALRREGLLPPGIALAPGEHPGMSPPIVQAIHRFLARSPAKLLTFQPEDVLEQLEQVNLPGTTGEHPNWRRKLGADLEGLVDDPRFVALLEALCAERGSGIVA
jgi:(1->4)-alpha-D-glucan 1-alpha-D-glucosylmutase